MDKTYYLQELERLRDKALGAQPNLKEVISVSLVERVAVIAAVSEMRDELSRKGDIPIEATLAMSDFLATSRNQHTKRGQ